MRHIFGDERLDERFWQLLDESNPRDRAYVYRIADNRPLRPALFVGIPYPDLVEDLRTDEGGGDFQVMIRRGEIMLIAGKISIAPLPAHHGT